MKTYTNIFATPVTDIRNSTIYLMCNPSVETMISIMKISAIKPTERKL